MANSFFLDVLAIGPSAEGEELLPTYSVGEKLQIEGREFTVMAVLLPLSPMVKGFLLSGNNRCNHAVDKIQYSYQRNYNTDCVPRHSRGTGFRFVLFFDGRLRMAD